MQECGNFGPGRPNGLKVNRLSGAKSISPFCLLYCERKIALYSSLKIIT